MSDDSRFHFEYSKDTGALLRIYEFRDAVGDLINPALIHESGTAGFVSALAEAEPCRTAATIPVVMPQVCARVDGEAMFVSPVALVDEAGDTTATVYFDDMGNPLLGTVESTDPCDCRCPDCPDTAQLRLLKQGVFNDESGDGFGQPGETISYFFQVVNTGEVDVTGIVINDPIIGAIGLPLVPPDLAPGESGSLDFTYTLTQQDVDLGEKQNVAIAIGQDPFGNDVQDVSDDPTTIPVNDDTITPLPDNPAIDLIKVGSYSGTGQVGEVITYAFQITNIGNVTLTGVNITDPLVTISGGPLASLAPGGIDTTTFTAAYTLTQADIDAGQVINQALVTSLDPFGNPVTDVSNDPTDLSNDTSPTVSPIPQTPEISLEKTATLNGTGIAGDTISYAFQVANTGNVTLTGVTIADPLVTISGGPIASLAPGAVDTTTFTATYTITAADVITGAITNQATVTATDPGGNPVTDISDDPATPAPDDSTVIDLPMIPELSATKVKISPDFTVSSLPAGSIEVARVNGNNYVLRMVNYDTGAIVQTFTTLNQSDANAIGYDSANQRIYIVNRNGDGFSYWDIQAGTQVQVGTITGAGFPGNANWNMGDYDDVTGCHYITGSGEQIWCVDTDTAVATLVPGSPVTPNNSSGDISFDDQGGYWLKSDFIISHYPAIGATTPDQTVTLATNGDSDGGGSLAFQDGVLIGAYTDIGLSWTIPIATGVTSTVAIAGPTYPSYDMTAVRLTNPYSEGVEVVYEVVICNTSDFPATNVIVTDPIADAVVSDPAGLATGAIIPANQCRAIRFRHTLTAADIAAGSLANTATATADFLVGGEQSNTIIIP